MANGFKSNKTAVMRQFEKNKRACLEALGLEAVSAATTEINISTYNTPVSASGYQRTGRLRSSLSYATQSTQSGFVNGKSSGSRDSDTMSNGAGKDEVIIGSNVEYAAFVELGTRNMSAQPYLRPAINNYQKDYQEVVEAVLGEGFSTK